MVLQGRSEDTAMDVSIEQSSGPDLSVSIFSDSSQFVYTRRKNEEAAIKNNVLIRRFCSVIIFVVVKS